MTSINRVPFWVLAAAAIAALSVVALAAAPIGLVQALGPPVGYLSPPTSAPEEVEPVEEITVDAGEVDIAAQVQGGTDGGDTLVIVNGGPGLSHEILNPVRDGLAGQDLRAVTYDQRGMGGSTAPADGDFSLAAAVRDLEALRVDLGVDRIKIFGFSFGGLIAQAYTAEHPDRVDALVLTGAPPADVAEFNAGFERFNQRFNDLQEEGVLPSDEEFPPADGDDCSAQLLAQLPVFFADPDLEVPDEFRETECSVSVGAAGNAAIAVAGLFEEIAAGLGDYTGPSLVLFGEQDPFGTEWADAAVTLLSGSDAEKVVFEGAGHNTWLESDDFLPTVERFLIPDGPR